MVDQQAERLAFVALVFEPVEALVGDDVGQITVDLHRVARFEYEVGVVVVALVRHDLPAVESGREAVEMPFSENGGLVSGLLQVFGIGRLGVVELLAEGVVGESVGVGVFPGQHAGAGRAR